MRVSRGHGILAGAVVATRMVTAAFGIELIDFAKPDLDRSLEGNARTLRLVEGGEKGRPALEVTFLATSDWPSLTVPVDAMAVGADWSAYTHLLITAEPVGPEPLKLFVGVRSSEEYRTSGSILLPAGKRTTLYMPLSSQSNADIHGMSIQPPLFEDGDGRVHSRLNPWTHRADVSHVESIGMFLARPKVDHTVRLYSFELVTRRYQKRPMVDRFGQRLDRDWPGKLHDEADLEKRRLAELEDWERHPGIPGYNKYGGWADGPTLRATGRFYVTKHEGKWWLVDPTGHLFLSTGLDCIRETGFTITKDREHFFEWLPKEGDPEYRHRRNYRGGSMNFVSLNRERKHGEGFTRNFVDVAIRRQLSWGFTTVGDWAHDEVLDRSELPFTAHVWCSAGWLETGTSEKAGMSFPKEIPDPFHPAYVPALRKGLQKYVKHKDNPRFLGVFVENEIPWVSGEGAYQGLDTHKRVTTSVLESGNESPLRTRLVEKVREDFPSITAFNEALGTDLAAFVDLGKPVRLDDAQQEHAQEVLDRYDYWIAEAYYRVTGETVREMLPGVLYLGSRFHVFSTALVRAAAKHCDIVSFNMYEKTPTVRRGDEMATRYDFPIIIGEFDFLADDAGHLCRRDGKNYAGTQAGRAEAFTLYMETMAKTSCFVGAHWFQYADEPYLGRSWDGENFNCGFVTVTDDPYPELVKAAREFHSRMYEMRLSAPAEQETTTR